jgi:hypothetical protein
VRVTDNQAREEGGGVFNGGAIANYGSPITDNRPDDCAGTKPVPGCASLEVSP